MNTAQTLAAIRDLPNMTARRTAGEYRVTIAPHAIKARYPAHTLDAREAKGESLAYYTDDGEDALGTARAMSAQWDKL